MSDSKVKISNILESQLPEFILDDNPLFKEFLEQYYLSQEHEYGTNYLAENIAELKNIDSYVDLKFTATTPKLTKSIENLDETIEVTNHLGFLPKNGLVKIGTEIFTYTGKSSYAQKVTGYDAFTNTIKLSSTVGLKSYRSQTITFSTAFSNVVAGKVYFVTEVKDSTTITISEDPITLDDVLNLDIADPSAEGEKEALDRFLTGTTATSQDRTFGTEDLPNATNFAFTGCIRGFSGIDNLSDGEFLNFSISQTSSHDVGTPLTNLGLVFLAEFFKKFKKIFLPGIENRQFQSVNIDNILSRARDFYSSKGTDTSLKILFSVLFGKLVDIIKPFDNTIQASTADFSLSDYIVVETISGDATNLGETTVLQGDVNNPTAKGIVSRVERILVDGKNFHKLYFPKDTIENKFNVSKKTKVLGVGSTTGTLTVDSTVGFPEKGIFLTPDLAEVSYGRKSYNQFFDCVGLVNTLVENDPITDGKYIFGYENNDINKLVTMRVVGTIVGVSSNKDTTSQFRKGDVLTVKHLGDKVEESDVRFNRWFYNNVVITDVLPLTVNGKDIITPVDHYLNKNDRVEIILEKDKSVVETNAEVNEVSTRRNVAFTGISTLSANTNYLIKKKLDFVNSNLSDDDILSNIQNTFVDKEKNTYVAFSGLPGYNSVEVTDRSKTFTDTNIDETTDTITINDHNFKTGEQVYYEVTSGTSGIVEGNYFVYKIDTNNIKLSFTSTSIDREIYVDIANIGSSSNHKLTPSSLFGASLSNQNNFKRIYRTPKPATEHNDIVGPIGVSLNGVEFNSPVSEDSIFYGQIDKVNILNPGSGYDIVNSPQIGIANTDGSNGATFVGQFSGKVENIIVTSPGFNFKDTPTVKIIGGNGTEALAEARMRGFTYSESFVDSARGNQESDTIQIANHRFLDGEEIIYSSTGNPIGIGSTNVGFSTDKLTSGAVYFIAKINDTEVSLAVTKERALSKTNLIDMNAFGNGVHKFTSRLNRKIIDEINIISSTDDFSNKKVIVDGVAWPPANQKDIYSSFVGINTQSNYIYARDHHFKTGDNIEYSFDGTTIAGLSTTANYKVTVLDKDRFVLSEAGTPTAISSVNFNNKDYVNITSVGVGTHTFKYPPIAVTINGIVSTGDTSVTASYYNATAVPVVRGSLQSVFIRSGGVGYGVSDIINYQRDIDIKVETGKEGVIRVIIEDGKITSAYVANSGSGYTSPPSINVVGTGTLAKLTATIVDGSITAVTVVNGGSGYDSSTRVDVIPTGIDAKLNAEVHEWKLNNVERYKEALQLDNSAILKKDRLNRELVQIKSNDGSTGSKLVGFYPGAFYRQLLSDNVDINADENVKDFSHSPIIGWAYDGNPIYGPYGHANAIFDGAATGGNKKILSSYELDPETSNGLRPSGFAPKTFTQDFVYKASGDLDEFNGRFCKTPEFPEGTYAYFSTLNLSGELVYPYITKSHYNQTDAFNYDPSIDQRDLIINDGSYKRNVTHLGINDSFRDYPFISESMIEKARVDVESIKSSRINSINVLESGSDYKVGEQINFSASSIDAEVGEVLGQGIVSIGTSETVLKNTIFSVRGNVVTGVTTTPHGFLDGDIIEISGIGSATYKNIEGFPVIGVGTVLTDMKVAVAATSVTGITTVISLSASTFTEKFVPDDIVKVGNELMKIVSIDTVNNRYRVTRVFNDSPASTHNVGDLVVKQPVTFNFLMDKKVQNKNLTIPYKQTFDISAVGIGSTAKSIVVGKIGDVDLSVDIPARAIFVQNHQFKTGDELSIVSVGGTIFASTTAALGNAYDISTGSLFAVNISNDFIGLATSKAFVGINSTLFFTDSSSGKNHTLTQVKDNITGTVRKVTARVVTDSDHRLQKGDDVRFHITPNRDQEFVLKFNPTLKKLVVNPKTFASAGIGTDITLENHGLKTGDLVVYVNAVGVATPLQNNRQYYAIRIDDDRFRLADSRTDSLAFPFQNITITEQGSGTHEISKVNPKLDVLNGGRIVLNVEDTSLSGFGISFYNDRTFQSKYESTLIKSQGQIGDGAVGSRIIIDVNKNTPPSFYYRIEGKDNKFTDTHPSSVDESVDNYSNIRIVDSKFNQNYTLTSVGSTVFNFTVVGSAETTSYVPAGFSTGFYSTSSSTAFGGIHSAKVINSGVNIQDYPAYTSVGTTTGIGARFELTDTDIGEIIDGSIIDSGVEFSEDNTLKPEADSSLVLQLENNRTLSEVGIVTSGSNYNVPPTIIAIGNDSIVAKATLEGNSVGKVEVISSDSNLREDLRIIAVNNSNGIGVVNATSNSQVNELQLRSPDTGGGFGANFPFELGDEIFVENVQITNAGSADGYNSSDYDYRTFIVTDRNTSAGTESISYSINGIGVTGGTYDISQSAQFGRVIKVTDLATFKPKFSAIRFAEGEKVVDIDNSKNNTDISGVVASNGFDEESGILRLNRVNGDFTKGTVIRGVVGNFKAVVTKVSEFDFNLDVGSTAADSGVWKDDIGKLSDSLQRLHDNDYYQRFSYSIRGEVELDKWKETVDSLDHTAGYKNFSDLQIISSPSKKAQVSIGIGETNFSALINSSASVHSRLSYDLASEDTESRNLSKIIKFDSKVITDYNESKTNKVLLIDDISPQFDGETNTSGQLVGLSTFTILNQGNSMLHHVVNPETAISTSTHIISITDHNFNTGEELVYDPTNAGINTGSSITISSINVPGIGATTILPETVFAINDSANGIKVAVSRTDALAGTAVSFVSVAGIGSTQSFSTEGDLATSRSIITIDNIIQSPIARKPVGVAITMVDAVGIGSTQIKVSDVSKIAGKSLLRFGDGEIVKVNLVGAGATNILNVQRGAMGTVAAAYPVGTASSVVSGDYRIKQGKIYFSDVPYGPTGVAGITTTSTFTGRIFYRLSYAENVILDDISESFDGATDQFPLISSGVAVTGITTHHGAFLINNVFQKPFLSPIGSVLVADYTLQKTNDGEDIDFTGTPQIRDLPKGGIINEFIVGVGSGYQVPTRAIGAAAVNGSGVITGVTVGVGSTGIVAAGAGHLFPPNVSIADTIGGGTGAAITATVGAAGTITGFTVVSGGTGYSQTHPPLIFTDEPAPYKNLTLVGGNAGIHSAKIDVVVGTGGSIISFNMVNRGMGYKEGDVLKLEGLPFNPAVGVSTADFTVTVKNKYQDKFSGWAFGELLELDDFSNQFNGAKTQFLLTRTEINKEFYSIVAEKGSNIVLQNNLLIFLNDVLQYPGKDYEFNGGTRLKFKEAPKAGSSFRMYFYSGSASDYNEVDVDQTIKPGDKLRLQTQGLITSQDPRIIYQLIASDTVQTETYTGVGINTDNSFLRPVEWTKQTSDLIIDGVDFSKVRNSLEPLYFPTTNIIQPVAPTDTTIHVEDVWSFSKVDSLGQSINNVRIVGFGTTAVVETINSPTYEGDYGKVIGISTNATGINTTSPRLIFDFIPDEDIFTQSGQQNKIQFTGISTGDYFVIRNSVVGSGITSIDDHETNIVGTGTNFVDNVYRAASVVNIAGTDAKRVSANILSLVGINTNANLDTEDKFYGTFSWGKINIGSRNGKSFTYQSNDPLSGLSTSAHISRTAQLSTFY